MTKQKVNPREIYDMAQKQLALNALENKSVINWLCEIFHNDMTKLFDHDLWKQAKEMELIQIAEAHIAGQETEGLLLDDHPHYWACDYYSHKFENQT